MTDLKIMETVWIHQPSGNVVMGTPVDSDSERFYPVKIVGIIEWLESEGFEIMSDYAETSAALKVYLKNHPNVTYWSEEKHKFFVSDAARAAYESGHDTVIVENMS
jgi:hypothetical protein